MFVCCMWQLSCTKRRWWWWWWDKHEPNLCSGGDYSIVLSLSLQMLDRTTIPVVTIGWGETFDMSSHPKPLSINLCNTDIKSSVKTDKPSFFSISSGAMFKLLFEINNTEKAGRDHHHHPHDQIIWHPHFLTLVFKAEATGQTKVMGKWMRTDLKILG